MTLKFECCSRSCLRCPNPLESARLDAALMKAALLVAFAASEVSQKQIILLFYNKIYITATSLGWLLQLHCPLLTLPQGKMYSLNLAHNVYCTMFYSLQGQF